MLYKICPCVLYSQLTSQLLQMKWVLEFSSGLHDIFTVYFFFSNIKGRPSKSTRALYDSVLISWCLPSHPWPSHMTYLSFKKACLLAVYIAVFIKQFIIFVDCNSFQDTGFTKSKFASHFSKCLPQNSNRTQVQRHQRQGRNSHSNIYEKKQKKKTIIMVIRARQSSKPWISPNRD